MKKKFYLNVFLFQLSDVTIKPIVAKMLTVIVKLFPGFRAAALSFSKQTSSARALSIAPAPVFYKVFNPLTAAWFT